MPIYDYKCDACNHQFEVKRGFNEETKVVCPLCQGEVRRIYSYLHIWFRKIKRSSDIDALPSKMKEF